MFRARLLWLVLVSSLSIALVPHAEAVVINEVYGGGSNAQALLNADFVELFNPTGQDVSIDGWELEQFSAKGNSGTVVELFGVVPAGGYYLISGVSGETGADLPSPDREAAFNFSATSAVAVLRNADGEVDRVAWGDTPPHLAEGAPAEKTTNQLSIQRVTDGTDTDNNAADFRTGAPTPRNSGIAQADPRVLTIAEIQGTGATTPYESATVITTGVVTAVYDEGGKRGFFMQSGGSGQPKQPGDASDGIFVFVGKQGRYPAHGDSVRVEGTAKEFYGQTQISASSISRLSDALPAPKPISLDALPAGDAAREPYEGMLVRPDAHQVARMSAQQAAEFVNLDDGRTRNYAKEPDVPLPYISPTRSIRTFDTVAFQQDVVVGYNNGDWTFQPLRPITGQTRAEDLPITWDDSRAGILDAPAKVRGDLSIGFFNVMNYFTHFPDIDPEHGCTNCHLFRGAHDAQALALQEAKLVNAINQLDTAILGLSEVENTARTTGDAARRDETLQHLVDALNAAAGEDRWAVVSSPSELGTREDAIRVAFIYQPAKVRPVGQSRIFDDSTFTGIARQPLAQEFAPAAGGDHIVAVVNHFKSKGTVSRNDDATADGQGNNARLRADMSRTLLEHLDMQDDWHGLPTFLIGDFNAYSQEDAIAVLNDAGYATIPQERPSYQYDNKVGSLDHVLANDAAMDLVKDSLVWAINSDEPLIDEPGTPFRSSDHNPVKVGFDATSSQSLSYLRAGWIVGAVLLMALLAALVLRPKQIENSFQ
ncbi:ExeM/NucH family extracellular endonuclease [Corynebacterium coyleae]|uniref:ExeM/NucH family extracellular endonuclease n=1 Tax=Corynebacterium coyleae TaxID=53374 RepID=A0AAP7CCT1_9CORY|nr:ExeM/NucH family extracellular endonuclease [Corynebacterium coyleae]NJJ04351.1 ExeM/NucH family extracellular endonuclease [Corynebacterium coyleae]